MSFQGVQMNKYCKIFFLFIVTSLPYSLQAFGIWQCAGMLLPELNPLCWDVCGFEIGAEALYLKKCDDSENIDFTSDTILGPIVLNSDSLDTSWKWGYKLIGQANLQGCKAVEIVWTPGICWSSSKDVLDENYQLFSVYSDFGDDPFGGYPDTDASCKQFIELDSKLQGVEVNVKKLWGICRGSFLYGYRYQCINEQLKYETTGVDTAWYRSVTEANNDMHGFQLGMDFCFPCSSCFSVEIFGKGAVYANCTEREFHATAGSNPDLLKEKESDTRTSWGVDAGIKILYEWCPASYFSFGYQYLSYHNVALALDNFSPASPFVEGTGEKLLVNDCNLSYHGFSIGMNFVW